MGKAVANIVGKEQSSQMPETSAWIEQTIKDNKVSYAQNALEGQSVAIPGADPYVSIADDLDLQQVLDSAQVNPDRQAALNVMQAVDERPVSGNNPNNPAFSGANTAQLNDMDMVNQGMAPAQSIAAPLRDAINAGEMGTALDMVGDDAVVLQDHTDFTGKVINELSKVATGMASNSSLSQDYITKISKDLRAEPSSVAEYMRTWVSTYKQFEANGIPDAFSDASLYAVLNALKNNRLKKDNQSKEESAAESEQEQMNASMALHEEIGGLIEGAFQIKNGTTTTRAIGGALAMRAVTDALGTVDYGRGQIEGKEGAGLFQTTLTKTADDQTVYLTELTEKGLLKAEALKGLGEMIIPGLKKDVNPHPPLDEKTSEAKTVSNLLQRKEDKSRRAGKAADTNKGIHALNSSAHKINAEVAESVSQSLQNPEAKEIIEGPGFMDIQGLEDTRANGDGRVHKANSKGDRINQRYVIQNEINGQPNPNPGRRVPNPNFGNPNFPGALKWVTEPNTADFQKDLQFDETLQWLADHIGDEKFHYTHFIGGAKRVHVDQTLGNYQSNKLARGMIESAIPYSYNLGRSDGAVVELKAGILKKFGMNKAKEGNNKQLAARFKDIVTVWQKAQKAHEEAGGVGIAPELLKIAAKEEGWSSVNAMVEGMKLLNAEKAKETVYRSGFITEIDGTANGVAINSMYAGDRRTAVLTGMIGSDPEHDVYTLTSGMFNELAQKHNGKLGPVFNSIWGDISASRGMSKQPLMTFGYGAGDHAIKLGFKEELWGLLEDGTLDKGKIKEMVGSDAAVAQFVEESAEVMVSAVGTNFPALKTLSSAISAIVGKAVTLGISPSTITNDNDFIEFGLSKRVIDSDSAFKGSLATTKGASSLQASRKLQMSPMSRVNDPAGVASDRNAEFELGEDHVSILKAVKQAPVLVTQSIDSLVMMRALDKMKQKLGNKFYAAQIFDGVMMSPAHAQMFSDALHRELIHMGKNYSIINSLLESIYNTDPQRFKDMAARHGMKKASTDPVEIMTHALKNIPKIKIYNQKTGKDEFHPIRKVINGLNARSADYVKKMKLENMYQYGWDFPPK